MSQMGHERHSREVRGTAALPPIATVERTFGSAPSCQKQEPPYAQALARDEAVDFFQLGHAVRTAQRVDRPQCCFTPVAIMDEQPTSSSVPLSYGRNALTSSSIIRSRISGFCKSI